MADAGDDHRRLVVERVVKARATPMEVNAHP